MAWRDKCREKNARSQYIPPEAIINKIDNEAVEFTKIFGKYLAKNDQTDRRREKALTTSQLRKFFGDLKRQQLTGYDETSFALLKPKLAYAVGRVKSTKEYNKIEDFADVVTNAINVILSPQCQDKAKSFNNFIDLMEAIVAYHKSEYVEKN